MKEDKITTTQSLLSKYIDYYNKACQDLWAGEQPMTYNEWYLYTLRETCANNYKKYLEGLTIQEIEKELTAYA